MLRVLEYLGGVLARFREIGRAKSVDTESPVSAVSVDDFSLPTRDSLERDTKG
jgi:hypothetical protein